MLSPLVQERGYELWALETKKQGSRLHLTVYIDSPHGISLDDCEDVSKHLDPFLEENDLIKGSYNLEVSSPGLERVLVKPSHFQRFVGEKVKIKVNSQRYNRKNISGVIEKADEKTVIILDSEGKSHSLFYNEITRARLWYPFIPGNKEVEH